MTMPIRSLTVVQNWDCHSCTDCCRIQTPVSDEDRKKIEALGQDLERDERIGPRPWFVREGWWPGSWTLRHRPDGSCVFLTAGNRCRLHERFGPLAKPLACRLFPFLLVPAGNHFRLGVRFMCPSAAANQGRPIAEQVSELTALAAELERQAGAPADKVPPPSLQGRQQAGWPELLRFTQALLDIVQDRADPLERRLRKGLALSRLCRQARFETVTGDRLAEFLHVVRAGLEDEVPKSPAELAPPGWLGRTLFRTLLAIFARKDVGLQRGPATRTPLGRMMAGWRFVRGRGLVPRVNGFLGETTFADVAARRGECIRPEVLEKLERYYVVKLSSLQYCGRAHFDLPFWTGLESLLLTFPMILWLTAAFAPMPPGPAVEKALSLVDDHFTGNRILGARHNRFFLRTLAERGELDRLIAWYGGAS